jgi:hypothetical protein
MPFELDHFFICANLHAPEAAQLDALGLTNGPSAIHRGQGTANRCFVFNNAYLELIWVHDEAEASSPLTEQIRLFERWKSRAGAACPFGICLRPSRSSSIAPERTGDRPFAGWDYVPQYVSASQPIYVGNNCENLAEPMLFFIESATRPDSWPRQATLQHHLGIREVTRLRWSRPADTALSPTLQAVVDAGYLDIEVGNAHTLTISFDHEATGQSAGLAPDLPISLKW